MWFHPLNVTVLRILFAVAAVVSGLWLIFDQPSNHAQVVTGFGLMCAGIAAVLP